jgi:tetratricopeptide (TPR) repeat protein
VPKSSTITEWSMTRSTGTSGLIFSGRRRALHGVAHGGEIDHGGHAGEVLHQHARRAEGDLVLGLALVLQPGGDARMSALVTSLRSRFSSSTFMEKGSFQLARLGREADSQKDIAEMGRVLPGDWQVVLSSTMPGLAGGGDRAAALRTLDNALQRKPGDPSLTIAQAQVYMQIADFQRALGLLDAALAGATPGERRSALFYRGHANFNLGNYAQAADDFDASLAGRPNFKSKQAPLLWRYAAQVRARRDARAALVRDVGAESLNEWPGPILRFLMGKGTAGELEVAAESDDGAKRANGKCPAAFFIGMDAVRRGDKQRAREQFQLAQARCPTVSELNWAASSELKRL